MKRKKELDFLKGFAIFLMVFDHVGWGGAVHTYIQSFHMPLFFIISGYLWKSGRSIHEIAVHRAKTVLVPYVFFAGVYLILLCVEVFSGRSGQSIILAVRAIMFYPTDMQNMPFAPALWFLPCFFLCNVIYAWLDIKMKSKKWFPILIIATIGMSYSSLTERMLPFTLEPLAVALLFMFLGEKVGQYEWKIFSWLKKWWVLLLALGIEVALAFLNGSVDLRSARYHNCFLYLLNAVIGTLVWWGISRKALKLLPFNFSRGVLYLGVNSISYVCMNQFFIKSCKIVTDRISENGLVFLVVSKLAVLIVALILCTAANEMINRTSLKKILGR